MNHTGRHCLTSVCVSDEGLLVDVDVCEETKSFSLRLAIFLWNYWITTEYFEGYPYYYHSNYYKVYTEILLLLKERKQE